MRSYESSAPPGARLKCGVRALNLLAGPYWPRAWRRQKLSTRSHASSRTSVGAANTTPQPSARKRTPWTSRGRSQVRRSTARGEQPPTLTISRSLNIKWVLRPVCVVWAMQFQNHQETPSAKRRKCGTDMEKMTHLVPCQEKILAMKCHEYRIIPPIFFE